MSFGRPVLPPDVGALNDDGDRGRKRRVGVHRRVRLEAGGAPVAGRSGASARSTPTTSEARLRELDDRARAPPRGSLAETGCGVAPSFHAAIIAS